MLKRILKKSIYPLLIIGFAVWMVFLDDYHLLRQREMKKTIKTLNEKKAYYENIIAIDSIKLNQYNNLDSLEKIAREQYLMKKENEDIYIIVKQKNQ